MFSRYIVVRSVLIWIPHLGMIITNPIERFKKLKTHLGNVFRRNRNSAADDDAHQRSVKGLTDLYGSTK